MFSKLDCDSERIWKIIDKYTPKDKSQKRPDSEDIYDNLYNCYISHLSTSSDKRFRSSTNLLQKLPPEVSQVSVIVSLYSDEKGYSIMLPVSSPFTEDAKEIFMPYENDDIFSYLDSGDVPPVLMEILGKTQHCHMYNGCIICEVRNYRVPYLLPAGEGSLSYESQLVLLKPSPEIMSMLINDFSRQMNCTKEDKLALESRVLMATQSPLCLDPDTDVVCVQNRIHYNRKKYHSSAIRRYLRRQCQARRSIMQLYSEGPNPETLLLEEFLSSKQIPRSHIARIKTLKERRKHINRPCSFEEIMSDVNKYARPVQGAMAPTEIISRSEDNTKAPPAVTAAASITRPGPASKGNAKPLKGADDYLVVKTEPPTTIKPAVMPTPAVTKQVPGATTKPVKPVVAAPPQTAASQQPRPHSRPVYARPVLPGITMLMGGTKVLPKLRPPITVPNIQATHSVSSTVPPTLKRLKQARPLPCPTPSASLPPLKHQPVKPAPSSTIALPMPQLQKIPAAPGGGGAGGGTKQKKKKQK